jgi:pimeloyl-ACP methyl ester carboxylesterase
MYHLLVLSFCFLPQQSSDPATALVGNWEGLLRVQPLELRLGFKVSQKDGKLTGVMVSIDQGNRELKLTQIELKDGVARLGIVSAFAQFEGKLSTDGQQIEGTLKQGAAKFPMTLKKVKELSVVTRSQEPKPPFPYRAEDVTYENTKAKVKLAGTITIPKGDGPFPAVLLITGSGPQDRDEAIMGHKPFLVLADHLSRHGIAVLRVDDRGVAKSTGNFGDATTFDFADDVMAGVAYLKTRPEVNKKRIGLIGHSEGGIIAPIVATRSSDVAFIVLLAGTGLPGDEILSLQGRLIAQAEGIKEERLKANAEIQKKMMEMVKNEPPSKELVEKLKKMMKEELDKMPADAKAEIAKVGMDTVMSQLSLFEKPWFKTFLLHDPRTVLRQVKCPVLALNGEKDLQVPCQENLREIAKALKEAANTQATIKAFPSLNHLFQTCTTGAVSEYVKIDETMNPEVLKTIADWIASLSKE